MAKSQEQLQAEYEQKLAYEAAKQEQQLAYNQALNQSKLQAQNSSNSSKNLFLGLDGDGGAYKDMPLVSAFNQYLNTEKAANPYYAGANAFRQTAVPQGGDFWDELAFNAIKGLGSGFLGQMGEQDIMGTFQEEMVPQLKAIYPQTSFDKVGEAGLDPDVTRLALINALTDEQQSNKLEQLGMKSSGGKYGASAMSPLAVKLIADRAGIPLEEAQALAEVSPYQLQTMMYTLGANTKPLGDTGVKNVTAGDNALFSISEAKRLAQDLNPGIMSALESGKITELYKNPDSTAYKFYGQVDKLMKEVARMNDSGALTQLDVDMFKPLTAGSPVYDSPEAIAERLNDLERYIVNKREKFIEASGKAGKNVSKFQEALSVPPEVPSLAVAPTASAQDLSRYTPAQIQFMKSKGMIK